MGQPHQCEVSFTDASGVRHSVQITAESLYEAAVLGVNALRSNEFLGDALAPAAILDIEVYQTLTYHTLQMTKLQNWLESSARTPAEHAQKKRLRELFFFTHPPAAKG
ncbi:MAG: hypothetical protein ABI693_23010 [Bryobacteraceae bacterium]